MTQHRDQAKLLAFAIYEIRILLSGYLGSDNPGDPAVRQAAHLSYALHNPALAILEGRDFDVAKAIQGLAFVDSALGGDFTERCEHLVGQRVSGDMTRT